jgi:putative endonuclease
MACFVYLLGSDGKGGCRTYVGWTTDLEKRLKAHNLGKGARSTRGRVWVLLHSEELPTRNAAMSREWHLKRDRAFRKRLLEHFSAKWAPVRRRKRDQTKRAQIDAPRARG